MALVLADRVQDLTTTTGTGTITLTSTPPAGFQSFGAAIGNGNTTYYTINGGSEWEVGVGTYTAAGTSLSRDTVLSSSNGGNLVNFSAGTKTVFVTYPAEKSVNEDVAGNVNINITGSAATATTATNLAAGAAGSVPYQTAANTTAFVATASGVLVGGTTPSFSTTPTLTGTNFTAIPNAALSNSAVTVGTTAISLGATSTTLAGLTSVTLTQDPTLDLQAATKQYVDTQVSAGIHFHQPVRVESPTNLNATYSNGTAGVGATLTNAGTQAALVLDGVTLSVADRVLIYTQTTQTENGIYVVTSVGSGSTNWVLTRSSDANTYVSASPAGLSEGSTVFVQQGTTGAGETYTCNTVGTITFGTTNITFAQISSAQIYSAGTGLTLTGTQFSLTSPVATTLGGTGLTTFGAANRAIFSSGTNTLTAGTLPTAAGGTGQTTYTDGQILIGKSSDGTLDKATLTQGTGITVTNGSGAITITNSAPDQTVSLTGSGTTTITGSYPNFNIASADQFVGTVTSVSASVDTTGTDIAVAVTNSTTTPAIALSIPTSSASARGALTSTDWSTFNAKQTALVSGTNIKTINGTSVLGSGDLSTLNTPLAVVGNATAGAEIRLPEDTDNGANYVALKAPDTLAANLTLTLPTADGTSGQVLQTNGSGQLAFASTSSGTQTFTSSGSITAGQAVALNSDGTVSTVTGVNSAEASLGQTTVDAGGAVPQCIGSFYDTNNDWTIFARNRADLGSFVITTFRINSSGVVSTSGSNSISYPVSSAVNDYMPVRIIRTGTNRYAVLYAYSYYDKYLGLFTVNATTGAVTNTGAVSIGSNYSSTINYDMDYDPVSDRVVVVYRSAQGTVTAIAFNPVNATQTAYAQFSATGNASNTIAVACRTTGGQFFLCFGDAFTSGVFFRTATISSDGTTITFVSSPAYGASSGQTGAMAYAPSIDRYIFIQHPSSGQLQFYMFNTSGSQVASSYITFTVGSSNATSLPQKSMVNDTLQLVQAILTNNSTAPSLQYGQVAYTASAFGASALSGTFPSSTNIRIGSFSPATSGIYTYTAPDSGGTNTLAVTFRPFSFSSNAQNFAGFATNTVTTGQNTIVAVPGGVATNQTSLTRNTEYYLNFNGSLVTTATPFGVVLRATSTTGGEVIRPVSARRPVSLVSLSSATSATIPLGAKGFRSIECYYSLSVSSGGNRPIISFTTTDGSTVTPTTTGLYSTGTTTITNTTWGNLIPVNGFSYSGLYAVDSSVTGGVSQGNYGGLTFSGNNSSMGNPATQINISFSAGASGTIMVYGIPA
jgi:hypothetical protein